METLHKFLELLLFKSLLSTPYLFEFQLPYSKAQTLFLPTRKNNSLCRLSLPCCSLEIVSRQKGGNAKLILSVSLSQGSLPCAVVQCLKMVVSYIVPSFITYVRKTSIQLFPLFLNRHFIIFFLNT